MAINTPILPSGPGIAKSALCQSMSDKVDGVLNKLSEYQQGFQKGLNDLKNTLSRMNWSTPTDVLDKINQIMNKAGDLIPDVTDFDKLIDMLNECSNLKEIGDATTLVRQTAAPLLNNSRRAIDGITQGMPEFNAVNTFNDLQSHITTNNVNTNVGMVKSILSCLYHVCGVDVSEKLGTLNNFLTSCNMDVNGNLSTSSLLASSGITDPSKIASFTGSKAAVDNITTQVTSSVSGGVDRVKSLTKNLHIP